MKELIVEKGKLFLFYKIDELFLHLFAVLLFNHSGNLVPAFSYMVRTESDLLLNSEFMISCGY